MSITDLYAVMASSGLPITYYAWPPKEAPALPWVAIVEAGSDNFSADGIAFQEIKEISIELYTKAKSPETEALVQTALTSAGIFWQKEETYIEEEHCFLITYEIEV